MAEKKLTLRSQIEKLQADREAVSQGGFFERTFRAEGKRRANRAEKAAITGNIRKLELEDAKFKIAQDRSQEESHQNVINFGSRFFEQQTQSVAPFSAEDLQNLPRDFTQKDVKELLPDAPPDTFNILKKASLVFKDESELGKSRGREPLNVARKRQAVIKRIVTDRSLTPAGRMKLAFDANLNIRDIRETLKLAELPGEIGHKRFQLNHKRDMASIALRYAKDPSSKFSAKKEENLGQLKSLQSSLGSLSERLIGLEKTEGIAPGALGGALFEIAGPFNMFPEANVARGMEEVLKGPIAKVLAGESGRLTDQDIARAGRIIPTRWDSKEVIQAKMKAINVLIKLRISALEGKTKPTMSRDKVYDDQLRVLNANGYTGAKAEKLATAASAAFENKHKGSFMFFNEDDLFMSRSKQ